ncbi:MAG: hypothetical protein IPM02_24845 [Betaproteobacteria bacterium]|nr:hypothetical protein [Betaproteobacteria bacterium]
MRRPDLQFAAGTRSAALALLLAVNARWRRWSPSAYKLHEHYDAAIRSLQFRFNKLRRSGGAERRDSKALTAVKGESAARFS